MVAVVLLVAADDPKADKERLQGSWRPVSAIRGGNAQDDAKEYLLTFEGDTFLIKRGGELFAKGTYKLDPTAKPKSIDMKITESPREDAKGKDLLGIYELDKDTLKWCFIGDPGDKERPTKFSSNPSTRKKSKATVADPRGEA
jgi:uncharacterized protein (TIGR03067 family)